jgi:type IV secretion system protein VirB2
MTKTPINRPWAIAASAGILALMLAAGPALAQSIDLDPVTNLLQGIIDTITGPLGIAIATLAVVGIGLSWFFGIIDFRQAMFVVIAIAIVASAATIVSAIWQT